MSEDEIAERIFAILQEFVRQVRERTSKEAGGSSLHGVNIHGVRSTYAGFSLRGGDDELNLMVELRVASGGLECTADFGTYRETFAEMTKVTVKNINDPGEVEELLRVFRIFAASQVDRASQVVLADAREGE